MRLGSAFISALLFAMLVAPAGTAAPAKKKPAAKTTKSTAKTAAATKPKPAPMAAAEAAPMRALVQAGKHPDLHWDTFPDVKADLEKVYAAQDWRPLWLDDSRPSPAAKALIHRLAGADSLGLEPEDFDAAWLERIAEGLGLAHDAPDVEERALFDVGLSVAAARFYSALDVGRIAPKVAHPEEFLPTPEPTPELSFADLRDADRQAEVLERIQPQFHSYQLLKNALARYRKLMKDPLINANLGLVRDARPGDPLPNAYRLRRFLEATGDLQARRKLRPKDDNVYAEELVEGVKRFQKRHGQKPDGILFVQTIDALERPIADRIRQVELTLERWRWLPDSFAAPPVFVNVPAFRLHAYRSMDKDRDDTLDMDILVGAADKSQTPLFAADMKSVVFRPWWDLPASIQNFELGPRAEWDWENMQQLGYVVAGAKGQYTDLGPESAERLARGADMRQRPGEKNALGLVKFVMPNSHNIYLHDTPARGLFIFPRRDMSHGCVRVADPPGLAEVVLSGNADAWTRDRAEEAMVGEDDMKVDLEQPVPVWIVYMTVEPSPSGEQPRFSDDIYGLDDELDVALARGFPYGGKLAGNANGKTDQGKISTDVPSGTRR